MAHNPTYLIEINRRCVTISIRGHARAQRALAYPTLYAAVSSDPDYMRAVIVADSIGYEHRATPDAGDCFPRLQGAINATTFETASDAQALLLASTLARGVLLAGFVSVAIVNLTAI